MNGSGASLLDWIAAALAFVYPETCQLCGSRRAGPRDGFVCHRCQRRVRFIVPPFCERCGLPYQGDIHEPFECSNCTDLDLHFRSARSAAVARGVVLEAIHRYKYHRALWFEPFLAGLLVRQAKPALPRSDWDCIVPVPLHPARKRHREFNQAERLARRLGNAIGLPVHARLLKRAAPTRTQTRLKREQRADNVRDAFTARHPGILDGERVVLVDDVFTTGATTSACARVLREAGAGDVCVWTVARGL